MHSLVSVDPRNVTSVTHAIVTALPEFSKVGKYCTIFTSTAIVRFNELAPGSGQFLAVVERRHGDYDMVGYAIVDSSDIRAGQN